MPAIAEHLSGSLERIDSIHTQKTDAARPQYTGYSRIGGYFGLACGLAALIVAAFEALDAAVEDTAVLPRR